MKLNHVDVQTTETSAARVFFERHFGFRCIFAREDGLTVLLDEAGFALTLSPLHAGAPQQFPSGFHIGFNVESKDEFYETHHLLAAAQVPIVLEPTMLGGALTFHCHAPGSILVEIAYRGGD
jgi:catechol 2,3-dioxygenase-like lactoylglutathione lyase family enzyme